MLEPPSGWEDIAPEWIRDLPRDRRGFPIPAEVPWQNGVPLLHGTDPSRSLVLGVHRRCAVCGLAMRPEDACFRAFAQADAARIRGYEREFANDYGGPAHESCMLFSAMACPHLRDNLSNLSRGSTINAGASRGTLAAVIGFSSYSLLVPLNRPVFDGLLFGYQLLVEDIRYKLGEDLRDRLVAATERDKIVARGEPMFWSTADQTALVKAARKAVAATMKRGMMRELPVAGKGHYGEFDVA